MLDIFGVMKALKHRYPFLLVDRILECDAEHAVGIKNVTINEPFFQGHFPGEPVMPGVLVLEAMGQVGSIMSTAQSDNEKIKDHIVFLTGIDKTKFRKPVRPGDTLVMKARMIKRRSNIGRAGVEAFVDGELVAEAEYLFFVATTLQKQEMDKQTEIHPTAVVSARAQIGDGVKIGPYCIIDDAKIGDGTIIEAHVRIGNNVEMGVQNHVHGYAVIGGDPQDHNYRGETSFVKIGDRNMFREYVTVNRATGDGNVTSIGNDNLIMEGVHIAHNAEIMNKVTIANKVGISGFVHIDDHAVIGGMVGMHQFIRIGKYCMVGGMYRVVKDIPPYTLAGGEPMRLKGLNVIGLRRAGFSSETRRELSSFYKKLYGGGRLFSDAIVAMTAEYENKKDKLPEIVEVINFYAKSKRGVTFWAGRKSAEAEYEEE